MRIYRYPFWPLSKWRFYLVHPSKNGPFNEAMVGFLSFVWPTRGDRG